MRIVPFGANAASRGGGTQAEVSWRVGPVDRLLRRGKTDSFRYQEAVSGDAQRAVMMKTSPAATFVVS